MEGLDKSRDLSLYIHVPFCARKCDYCAFYSVPVSGDDERIEKYMSFILAELDALSREWGRAYKTIFIGGGNPGLLGYERILRILDKAMENGRSEEVTVEINPENVREDISILSPAVTRISLGIQSMNDSALKTLGRNASREENLRALSILSSSPFDWNADIITAIPGTAEKDTVSDIEEVASYDPDHISFYCLTFEEGTPLIKREKPIGEDREESFLLAGWKALERLGYEHYEISGFAKKGKRCRHNLVYWNLGQYVGIGPSAESSVGYSFIVSMRDSETLDDYLKRPEMTCSKLRKEETEEEFLIVSLRIKDGIDKEEYRRRFSSSFDERYGKAISALDKSSYIDTPERFALTEAGFMQLDWIILRLASVI